MVSSLAITEHLQIFNIFVPVFKGNAITLILQIKNQDAAKLRIT